MNLRTRMSLQAPLRNDRRKRAGRYIVTVPSMPLVLARPWMSILEPADLEPRPANRVLDLVLGLAGIAVTGPVLVGVAMAMRLSGDRGPLLYRARRVGQNGRIITVHKVRTMLVGTAGLPITHRDDHRITPVGRALRHFKLDELPQFFDVVRGEMSVVGPRPEDPRYVDWSDPLHRFVFSARPGITGPSQIAFRHEERLLAVPDPEHHYRTVVLPAKVQLDADYLRRRTIKSDLVMVGATVRALLDRGRPD